MDYLQISDLAWHKHSYLCLDTSIYFILCLPIFQIYSALARSPFSALWFSLAPPLPDHYAPAQLRSPAASIHCRKLSSWGLCVFAFWFLDYGLCPDVSPDLPFCLFRVPRLSLSKQPVTPSLLPQSLCSSHFHHPSAVDILCCTDKYYFLWKLTPDILDLDSLKVCSLNTINGPIIEIGII